MLKEELPLIFISNLHCLFSGSLSIGAALRGVCRVPQFLSGSGKIGPFTFTSEGDLRHTNSNYLFYQVCPELYLIQSKF